MPPNFATPPPFPLRPSLSALLPPPRPSLPFIDFLYGQQNVVCRERFWKALNDGSLHTTRRNPWGRGRKSAPNCLETIIAAHDDLSGFVSLHRNGVFWQKWHHPSTAGRRKRRFSAKGASSFRRRSKEAAVFGKMGIILPPPVEGSGGFRQKGHHPSTAGRRKWRFFGKRGIILLPPVEGSGGFRQKEHHPSTAGRRM